MIEGSENWEVGPCFDPTGRHVTSWDIWVKPESDAIGVAVIASVYSGEVVAREILAAIEATRPPIVTDEVVEPQSLGAIPGSHPTDQAPSGLGASRFDPERVERVARAIAAGKRDPRTPSEEIDRVWTAYCGQARAALAADDSALANENADLIHDLERQMTIANVECNVAESARDALRQCARLARMESSSLATAIVETVNNALASVDTLPKGQDAKQGLAGTEGSAVANGETPTPGSTIDQDGGE